MRAKLGLRVEGVDGVEEALAVIEVHGRDFFLYIPVTTCKRWIIREEASEGVKQVKGWMNDKPVRDSFSIHANASHYMGRSGSHLLKMELAGAYINTPINSPRIPLLRNIPVSNSIPRDTMTGHGRKETDGAHHSYTPTCIDLRADSCLLITFHLLAFVHG